MSSPSSEPLLAALVRLCGRFADPSRRRAAAREIAGLVGADDLLVAIEDPEIGALLPAPGFPQTLPDGLAWQAFFAASTSGGHHTASLRDPDTGETVPAIGVAADSATLAVLLGGCPDAARLDLLAAVLPHLAATLRAEQAAQAARAQAQVAERAAAEAEALALALDQARARMEALAAENARLYAAEAHARAEAEAALRARDEFLSIASHELRTPVAVIKGVAQRALRLHRQDRLEMPLVVRSLDSIDQLTDRLARLLSDLLDVSRMQEGQLAVATELLDLVALLRSVVALHTDQLEPHHRLEARLPEEALVLLADAARLQQVFDNLLANAIKYSPAGGTLEVALTADETGAMVRVADPGIGLPHGAAERIFEPFGRAENAAARHIPGMGLGLFISRRIVHLHGGRIWAESAGENAGTSVYVWLPRYRGDAVAAAA